MKIIEKSSFREHTFIFEDRFDAGKHLSEKLQKYAGKGNVVLLAVPAGGVPVGYIVAKELNVPLDVVIVRKIQIPWNTEAGFGAVTWDEETTLNEVLIRHLGLTEKNIEESISKTKKAVFERVRRLRGDRQFPEIGGNISILVDDGLASGFTMLAAVRSIRRKEPEKTVVAVPTGSSCAIKLLSAEVDEMICLNIRTGPVFAVADAYKNWYDLTDEDVIQILKKSWRRE